MSEYIDNILGQPAALRSLLAGLDLRLVSHLAGRVRAGDIDRIILTGMGASLYAAYPAYTILAGAGLPAWWLETGELAESARALVTSKTLLWIISQSGKVPEGLALLDVLSGRPPGLVLATTNKLDSLLAGRAGLVLPLHTAPEQGVATRSYVNTLAVTQLVALAMAGHDLAPALEVLRRASETLETYLLGWEQTVAAFSGHLPQPDRLLLLGRGASLAAALDGALVLKEAARAHVEGMSMGQFRHGPLELADSRLTVLVFPGPASHAAADRQLARTIVECGARALWISSDGDHTPNTVPAPAAEGVALPIAQIVPVQLLSLYLAQRQGFEAAAFRHMGKVTWP
jgi:glucosamine--fructose-6-phosphate aminotransferase (isomerizing)